MLASLLHPRMECGVLQRSSDGSGAWDGTSTSRSVARRATSPRRIRCRRFPLSPRVRAMHRHGLGSCVAVAIQGHPDAPPALFHHRSFPPSRWACGGHKRSAGKRHHLSGVEPPGRLRPPRLRAMGGRRVPGIVRRRPAPPSPRGSAMTRPPLPCAPRATSPAAWRDAWPSRSRDRPATDAADTFPSFPSSLPDRSAPRTRAGPG